MELITFAQKLVRTPSLSGEEKAVAQIILQEMQALGFDQVAIDENGSIVGWMEGAHPGPTLLLDAHCDTVGIAPGSHWTHDPFTASISDGCIYGRGIADMKGALAAMIHAAAKVDKSQIAGRVVVSATTNEEVLEGVTLKTVMDAVKPDFVVIGEATELNISIGGRGRAEIQIKTIGKPAHSSSPHLGVNAVHLMTQVIAVIEELPHPYHPMLGEGIIALTDIISDPYPAYSVVPSRCRVTYDRRLLLGETAESILSTINAHPALENIPFEAVIAQGKHTAYTGQTLQTEKFFPAWMLEKDHPFAVKSLRGVRSAGIAARVGTYRFCTNAAYSAGVAHIPTIGFGPGAEGDAHVVDEHLSIDALEAAEQGYLGIIRSVLRK